MLQELVQIGDKVELKQLDDNGNPIKTANTYVSQVVCYIDEDKISIATPIRDGLIVILNKWANYRMYLYTAKGLFQCNCQMLTRQKEDNSIILKITSKPEKIQRRKYFRVQCEQDIVYRHYFEEELELENKLFFDHSITLKEKAEIRKRLAEINNSWTKGHILDLSGGGCRFYSKEELKAGEKIVIKLDFIYQNEVKKLEITSVILASDKMYKGSLYYEHRAEFSDISPKDREDLIKYIFEQERLRRRKEKK